jgi:predicted glycoside hydrolase/deacetylase ChbG (UPF0249 family)
LKLIINCDDLGISELVNASIFALMEQRRVTSATLLMNASAIETAALQLRNYPECSFGVHLNVTEFVPLSGHPGLNPLLNANGAFAENIRRIPLTSSVRQAVFAEWCAQVERAIAWGIPVSHLDSHHHAHTVPGLFGVLKDVQREFGIRKVRLTRNLAGTSESKPMALMAMKAAWNFMLRHWYSTRTTDRFTSFGAFYERLQAGHKLEGTIELACHPGGEDFAAETELLKGPWKEKLQRNVELMSYNEL